MHSLDACLSMPQDKNTIAGSSQEHTIHEQSHLNEMQVQLKIISECTVSNIMTIMKIFFKSRCIKVVVLITIKSNLKS